MGRRSGLRIIIAIMIVSSAAFPAIGDDAGSGGDAGSSMTSAIPLSPSNGTYNGNLSSSGDTTDYYSIDVPNGTGISVGLDSPAGSDFDIRLRNTIGNTIDSSASTSYDEVSSNGSNVGGTTVYIEIYVWSGSGTYTMTVWLFPSGISPPANQNDANTGGDASNSQSSPTPLPAVNGTYFGEVDNSNDQFDWYYVPVPNLHSINATLSWNSTSTTEDLDLYLYDDNGTRIAYSWYDNPEAVGSGAANIGGTNVSILIDAFSGADDYTLEIWLTNSSTSPGLNQNDANSGGDAGNGFQQALPLPSSNGTYYGWASDNGDDWDVYSIQVPDMHEIEASLGWNTSSNDFDFGLFDESESQVDASFTSNPETISSSSLGNTTAYIVVQATTGEEDYELSVTLTNLSSTPAFNQNDANSGGDAGNALSQALALPDANGTYYYGWASDSDDSWDVYSVQVPYMQGIEAFLSWNTSSNDFDMGLYDESQSQIDTSFNSNPELVQSGSTNVSNTTVYIVVQATTGEEDYTLWVNLVNQTPNPVFNQNDANSGGDAGDDFSSSTPLPSVNGTYYGWISDSDSDGDGVVDDEEDYYSVYVPNMHSIEVSLSWNNSDDYDLTLYDQGQGYLDSSLFANPESVDSGSTNVSDTTVYISVLSYSGEGDYTLVVSLIPLDADGDGFLNDVELDCGSDPYDNQSIPSDTDADGICDYQDPDLDGDGVSNEEDNFPYDSNESSDSDQDGIGDNSDLDDDNDGWSDLDENSCGTNPNDFASVPGDHDGDGSCDQVDDDIDDDGYLNANDAFDFDSGEWNDTDGDGIGDNSDGDDDGDGFYDGVEIDCLSDPLDGQSTPTDTDSDGVCDEMDDDLDGDGTTNDLDDFPFSQDESTDTDGDGLGDNSDPDDDNDGYQDLVDEFPLNGAEWSDNDGDCQSIAQESQTTTTGNGCGDNSDPDDDNDEWTDSDELECGTNPYSSILFPPDFDGDGICDILDDDDDDDGYNDSYDAFQFDPTEWIDTDGDGTGNEADDDDDGDGWPDSDESSICSSDPLDANSVPLDNDNDMLCDAQDDDDDNDGWSDLDDHFPFDSSEYRDTDLDGTGNEADDDDDGDGWPDSTELLCGTSPLDGSYFPDDNDNDSTCDPVDPDDDNDGVTDENDRFPFDGDEWEDLNNDGRGDNEFPLTLMDKAKLSPGKAALTVGAIGAVISAAAAFAFASIRSSGGKRLDYDEFEDFDYSYDDGDYQGEESYDFESEH